MLCSIIADIGSQRNLDTTNGISADDVLCLALPHVTNADFLNCLEEQLLGMSTGFCAQGRTTRLWQVVLAFSNFKEELSHTTNQ